MIHFSLRRVVMAFLVGATSGSTLVHAIDEVDARARQIHQQALVIDTHDDTPQRMLFLALR